MGPGITNGTGKHIVWDAGTDRPGIFTSQARAKVIATEDGGGAEMLTITLPDGVSLEMVLIPAGGFQMGSPDTERSRFNDEDPVHTVTIGYNFYMGKTEVTQAQWLALMGSWPEAAPTLNYGLGDDHPAYYVSWVDAQDFISALNTHINNTEQGAASFRLPSESEWEYACRAGTSTRFSFGDSLDCAYTCEDCAAGTQAGNRSDYMWYCGNNEPYGAKPVGTKLSNAWGLHDMHGNLLEWCQDWWHGSYTDAPLDGSAWESPTGSSTVVRGGGYFNNERNSRSASRGGFPPGLRVVGIGFRLARTQ